MTQKRFTIADDYAILDSTQNNEIGKGIYVAQDPVEAMNICKLLNELDSENQRLKLENDGLRYALKNIKQIDVEIEVDD